jgi:ABC-2 type transport system permease protein
MTYKIARAELKMLFYSPVAWLLLIVFAVQSAMMLTGIFETYVQNTRLGGRLMNLSMNTFAGRGGLFVQLQGYLYFYIPLLTMGLVSKELSSGSIRLLYSSPVTNLQIILGKYAAVMVYGLLMIALLFACALYANFTIQDFEFPAILTGLLGLYLLVCAYAAIGIFMSSLTAYQIIAAIGTLAVFIGLSLVGRYGQQYDFIRDVTWWLSINGRVGEFVNGMVCSEDLLYFLIVIALFLSLTVIRLNAVRQKVRLPVTLGRNAGVILLSCLLGYFSSRPQFMSYHDATHTKRNTLTPNSQEVVDKMKGGLTITSYANILGSSPWYTTPAFLNPDRERFRQYARFKPEIKLKYVNYYDKAENNAGIERRYPDMTDRERMVKMAEIMKVDSNKFMSPEEIRQVIDLAPEGNSFVRQVVRESGEKVWLRIFNDMRVFPDEAEITAAFKRLVMPLPKVGFLEGHNERDFRKDGDRAYSSFASSRQFRYALMNQGFNFAGVRLNERVPEDIDILVIADMFTGMTPDEWTRLQEYIDRGGNLFILGEPRRREVMKPLFATFGFAMTPGTLVREDSLRLPDIMGTRITPEAGELTYQLQEIRVGRGQVAIVNAAGLAPVEEKGFAITTVARTDSVTWNEMETTHFTDEDTVRLNPAAGESMGSRAVIVALSRQVGEKEQKVILSGDADCLSNSAGRLGIPYAANFQFTTAAFCWLSDGRAPIDVRRPPLTDNQILIGEPGLQWMKASLLYALPLALFAAAILIWIRRKGR